MTDANLTPTAQSEPRDLEDEVISGLLKQCRQLAVNRDTGCSQSALPDVLNRMSLIVEADPDLARLIDQIPAVLGSGALLQSTFMRLFPGRMHPLAVPRFQTESVRMTPRECEILAEMAKGRTKSEIAKRLTITTRTVKTHFHNIYAKLEEDSPPKAVAKAAALGFLPHDLTDLVLPMVDGKNLDLTRLSGMLLGNRLYGNIDPTSDAAGRIASLGLLLFLIASQIEDDDIWQRNGQVFSGITGAIFELTGDGELVRELGNTGCLRVPLALSLAPPSAARHGMTAGNLYVLNGYSFPDALNRHTVVELDPCGSEIRSFTGGEYLSTRINGDDLAFTADGRLIVSGANQTDALLEFTDGGRRVRRLAEINPHGGLTTDDRGNTYVAGGRWYRNPVHVYDSSGILQRVIGAAAWKPGEEPVYRGVALDARGNLYVCNVRDGLVEVYDCAGRRTGSISSGVMKWPWRLAVGMDSRLYVLESDPLDDLRPCSTSCRTVHVFGKISSVLIRSVPAPPGVRFTNIICRPGGNLFVTGYRN